MNPSRKNRPALKWGLAKKSKRPIDCPIAKKHPARKFGHHQGPAKHLAKGSPHHVLLDLKEMGNQKANRRPGKKGSPAHRAEAGKRSL